MIRDYLQKEYHPVADPASADFCMSTTEMYHRLRDLFPAEGFDSSLLFSWLVDLGFQFRDLGEMKVEWLLKKSAVL
jgi:hypothetical protein